MIYQLRVSNNGWATEKTLSFTDETLRDKMRLELQKAGYATSEIDMIEIQSVQHGLSIVQSSLGLPNERRNS